MCPCFPAHSSSSPHHPPPPPPCQKQKKHLCSKQQLATQIVGSLLALEAMDETAPIRMYINSPGGTPYSIIGVVDAMQVCVFVLCVWVCIVIGVC